MAKISKTKPTAVFAAASKASKTAKEKNDCAVVALSTASGRPYDECHSALEASGRKIGCATFLTQLEDAAAGLGLKLELLGSPERVGVKDIPQFLHWFPPESLDWFTKEGYWLDTYEVPSADVSIGKYQLMFDISKAKRISRQRPNVLNEQREAA